MAASNGLTRFTYAGSDPAAALSRLANILGRTPLWTAHRLVTATTTIGDADSVLLVDTAGGAVTVNLPPAIEHLGRAFTVKKMNAAGANVTLDAAGSDTIDGAGTNAWNTQYTAKTVLAVLTAAPATASWVLI